MLFKYHKFASIIANVTYQKIRFFGVFKCETWFKPSSKRDVTKLWKSDFKSNFPKPCPHYDFFTWLLPKILQCYIFALNSTLYNVILLISRNLLETRENIKIESHSSYHIICDGFPWGSSIFFFLLNKNTKILRIGNFEKSKWNKTFLTIYWTSSMSQ